jgi:hypothetical protein
MIKEIIDVMSEAKTYDEMINNVDKNKLFPILEA